MDKGIEKGMQDRQVGQGIKDYGIQDYGTVKTTEQVMQELYQNVGREQYMKMEEEQINKDEELLEQYADEILDTIQEDNHFDDNQGNGFVKMDDEEFTADEELQNEMSSEDYTNLTQLEWETLIDEKIARMHHPILESCITTSDASFDDDYDSTDDQTWNSWGRAYAAIGNTKTNLFNDSDTIVFHPDDRSTDFLSAIYEGKGFNVLTDRYPMDSQVRSLINSHKRVICLGHGSPSGLFGGGGYMIDSSHAELLKDKEVVAIWCHANSYMQKHELQGFFTGMFISELEEAHCNGIHNTTKYKVIASNHMFASILGDNIDNPEVLKAVMKDYYVQGDEVIAYNSEKLRVVGNYRRNL